MVSVSLHWTRELTRARDQHGRNALILMAPCRGSVCFVAVEEYSTATECVRSAQIPCIVLVFVAIVA